MSGAVATRTDLDGGDAVVRAVTFVRRGPDLLGPA